MSINYNSGLNLSGFGGTGGGSSNPFNFGFGGSTFSQPAAQSYSSYSAPAAQSYSAPATQYSSPTTGLPNYQAIQQQSQNLYAGMPNYNQNVQATITAMSPPSQNASVQQGAQTSSQPNQAHQIISSLQQQPSYPQQAYTGGSPNSYDPNLSPATPVARMPGGAGIDASGHRVPYWGPGGETENQAMTTQPYAPGDFSMLKDSSTPTQVANALISASKGAGNAIGGWNPGYATMQSWLDNPQVQQALPFNYTPTAGYLDWQQGQSATKTDDLLSQLLQQISSTNK